MLLKGIVMYELRERIRYSQLDSYGGMSLKALLDIYQDCATMHTQDVGYPMDWFIENDRGWFVISYQMKNYRHPRHGEEVICKTFPTKIKGFMGYRLFTLETTSGELLAEAFSEWVYMDKVKLRPARLPEEMIAAYELFDMSTENWKNRKIELPKHWESVGDFVVDNVYLDTNFHMNNACYIVPAIAAMEGENGEVNVRDYSFIRIEFKTSAKKDDRVFLKKSVLENRIVVLMESESGEAFCVVEFNKDA